MTLESLRAVGEGIDLTLRGALDTAASPKTLNARISGEAQATVLELVRPGLAASGRLTFDVAASGTVEKPEFNGSIRIADGRYRGFGYSFEDLEGTLRLVGNGGELEGLRARVADGEAFAAGNFRLDGGKLSSFRVALQGRRVSVRAIPSLRLIVDADLVASGDLEDREIRGEITLLRGTYTKDVEVTVSDLLARSRPGAALAAREPWKERTALDIRIVSAASLEVRNNVARLSGTVDLDARGTLAEPVLLGQILLDEGGRVVFSDVRYEIEYGAITFSNTTTDRAVRRPARPRRDQGLRPHRVAGRDVAAGRGELRLRSAPLQRRDPRARALRRAAGHPARGQDHRPARLGGRRHRHGGGDRRADARHAAALQARPVPDRPGLRGQQPDDVPDDDRQTDHPGPRRDLVDRSRFEHATRSSGSSGR